MKLVPSARPLNAGRIVGQQKVVRPVHHEIGTGKSARQPFALNYRISAMRIVTAVTRPRMSASPG